MDTQTRQQIATTLRAAAHVLRASGRVVEQGPTPLDYKSSADIQRLALVDTSAPPPDPKDTSFAGGVQKTSKGTSKLKPAEPGTVAFIDYSLYDGGTRVFIHFMETRQDQRKKGHSSKLLDSLYDKFKDAAEINWGKVMSDQAESLFMKYKAKEPTRTYGKL